MITNENINEVAGLCITCNHAGFCIYLASASSTIWCCEEFDDRPPIIKLKKDLRVPRALICGSKTMDCFTTGRPWQSRNRCFVSPNYQQRKTVGKYCHERRVIPRITWWNGFFPS